ADPFARAAAIEHAARTIDQQADGLRGARRRARGGQQQLAQRGADQTASRPNEGKPHQLAVFERFGQRREIEHGRRLLSRRRSANPSLIQSAVTFTAIRRALDLVDPKPERLGTAPMKIVRPEPLKRLVAAIFSAAGCRSPEPERIAHYLVESNLVGHDSHGVIRVLTYTQWLREGKVLANRSLEIVFENDNLAVVDGGFGFGQTIGEAAVRLGIAKTAHSGVAAIALRNCGHLGRIGDWPTLAAEAGLVSLHFVNTSGLGILMAPF